MKQQLTNKQVKIYALEKANMALNLTELNNDEMFDKDINYDFYQDHELFDLELNAKDKEAILQSYNELRKKLNS